VDCGELPVETVKDENGNEDHAGITNTHTNEAITAPTTAATTQNVPVENTGKVVASELETLPGQGDWSNFFYGATLVGVFAAIFLWLGGARCLRRLTKGDEVKYGKIEETDPRRLA